MHPSEEAVLAETRRQFFARGARGIGGIALAGLLGESAQANPKGVNFKRKNDAFTRRPW